MKRSFFFAWILVALISASALSQARQASPYDGFTQSGLTRGAAAGNYPLEGIDHINLANGPVSLRIPLLQIGGRGKAGFTMFYTIDRPFKVSRGQIIGSCVPSDSCSYINQYYVDRDYWASSIPRHYNFTPGILLARHAGRDTGPCGGSPAAFDEMLTRLTFVASDGTETQLVDAAFNGQPKGIGGSCSTGQSRGTIWYSTDGSAMTFISDTPIVDLTYFDISRPSGNLMMKDGTRYRIDDGRVTEIRDSNGNKVTIAYPSSTQIIVTDSLKRVYEVNGIESLNCTITFKGFGGATRIISVIKDLGISDLRPDFTSYHTLGSAFSEIPNLQFPSQGVGTAGLGVNRIVIPDNRQYRIWYNNYGEVARLDLPTGGRIEWDWAGGYNAYASGVLGSLAGIHRRVTARRVYLSTSDTTPVEETKYSRPTAADPTTVRRVVPGTETNISVTKHYFIGDPTIHMTYGANPVTYAQWDENLETKTEIYNTDGTTLIRKVDRNYQPRITYTWSSFDPQLRSETTTLADVSPNLVSKVEMDYDNYNNVFEKRELDYGSGSPGSVRRRTRTYFLTTNPHQSGVDYAATNSIHIRNLPEQVFIYDGNPGTARAQKTYVYDDYTSTFTLQDRSGLVQHDSAFSVSYQRRGNLTGTVLDNTGFTPAQVFLNNGFDIAGNVVKLRDGNFNITTLDFEDNFGSPDGEARTNSLPTELAPGESTFAFPRKVTNPLGHEVWTQYSYYLGAPVDNEDENGVKSSTWYDDPLERPTKTIAANGTSIQQQEIITYNDDVLDASGRRITREIDQLTFNDKRIKNVSRYDGLGRTWRNAVSEGSTWSITDQTFDELGRIKQVSNPFRDADIDVAVNPSGVWNTRAYDALSRVIQRKTPDDATVTTLYTGREVKWTDQAGKQRKTVSDGLGRIIEVIEDPGGSLQASTTYLYTIFDKPYKSTQTDGVTQNRYWLYDRLARLTATRHPEQDAPFNITDSVSSNNSWSNRFVYDDHGNLTTRADARGLQADFYYDELNRPYQISYNDGSGQTLLFYDNSTTPNGKGRLDYWERQTSSPSIGATTSKNVMNSYDARGRVTKKTQSFWNSSLSVWRDYPIEQTYNLAGQVTQVKYPSLRTVNYTHDQAARVITVNGNIGGIGPVNYVTNITYNPNHQPLKETWGTDTTLYFNRAYNNRHQMFWMGVGTSPTDPFGSHYGALSFYHSSNFHWDGDGNTGGTGNNGNIYRNEHFIPLYTDLHEWVDARDDYTYDALNRLQTATERSFQYIGGTQTDWESWKQVFTYDKFGNMKFDHAQSYGVSHMNFDIDKNNNRMAVPTGGTGTLTYDAAGNLTYDFFSFTLPADRTFDADSKVVRQYSLFADWYYVYDANGQRVRKIQLGGSTTWYIYGIQGEFLAEYAANAAPGSPQKEFAYKNSELLTEYTGGSTIRWAVSDSLGTPRMRIAKAAVFPTDVTRNDFLPFGEPLFSGTGVRTGPRGYAGVSSSHAFTGHQFDSEMQLTNMGARYQQYGPGRFISVDAANDSINLMNPQSLNRYAYVLNRPTTMVDPDGMKPVKSQFRGPQAVKDEIRTIIATRVPANAPNRNAAVIEAIADYYSKFDGYVYSRKLGRSVDLKHFAVAASMTIVKCDNCRESEWKSNLATEGLKATAQGYFFEYWQLMSQLKLAGLKFMVESGIPTGRTVEQEQQYLIDQRAFADSAFDAEDPLSNDQGIMYMIRNYRPWFEIEQRLYQYLDSLDIAPYTEVPRSEWRYVDTIEREKDQRRRATIRERR